MFYGFADLKERERVMNLILQVKQAYQAIGARTYTGDMLCTFGRNQGFVDDAKFREAFDGSADSSDETSWLWRLHTLTWAGRQALALEGDFVECGTFRGFMSAVVCKYLDFEKQPKSFYLYDSFAGLPDQWSTPAERHNTNPIYARAERYNVDAVRARFARYPNVRICQGVVPDVLIGTAPERIAYLHIDLNAASAEIAALDILFDRVVPGGTIVFDDFGHMAHAAQYAAETTWMGARGYSILELPTGQGLVIKR
ncbi:MAG TPA: TylF/MycF/NovP-related O-methyltransferase [Candidatus Cybelea sp.]|nr:TylF/MycF/NovP-related O-methyltransferase [Candidatus Cybelea sp.]